MNLITALWHLLNFLGPAVGVSALAAALAKAIWRRRLKGVTGWALWWPTFTAASAVSFGGLIVLGRDGKMATYGALVVSVAAVLWFLGRR